MIKEFYNNIISGADNRERERESNSRSPRSFFARDDFRICWKLKKERGSSGFNLSKNFL